MRSRAHIVGLLVLGSLYGSSPQAGEFDEFLPPLASWTGASERLVLPGDHAWATPFEQSELRRSPSYAATTNWLRRLVDASPQLEMTSLGRSHEGRDIWMVIASREGAADPTALRATGRPTLLAQAGIHSGEIDGKDAGMMLLRDMTVRGTHAKLLEQCNLLFIPILSVDAHERSSAHSRVNQRGPERMGWRTNARNQNLNRDFSKADTPEIQSLLGALRAWPVDFYIDLHVTDGADYQYDVTIGFNGPHAWSPSIAGWLESVLQPRLFDDLRGAGHVPGPLVFAANSMDMYGGNWGWTASPRFSNGYADARHLPGFLVENHSLKPFDRRVLGTRVLLESTMRILGSEAAALRAAAAEDRSRRRDPLPLAWRVPADAPPPVMEFLGIRSHQELSAISGAPVVRWTGEPETIQIPLFAADEIAASANRPLAYYIPPSWPEIIGRLRMHGIEMETLSEARTLEVEMLRLSEIVLRTEAYEGHVRVSAQSSPERRMENFAAGSVRISTDQPLGDLAMLLLEPLSPDSFFQWGFFLEILQRTEYVEAYLMEPLAQRMLDEDPALADEFRQKLIDEPEFAGDAQARLEWFYQRTPYFDDRWRLYPVARER